MAILLPVALLCAAPPARGQSGTPESFRSTDLPLPRFASVKDAKAYVRAGPGMQFPYKWVYRREGLPVEITQEFDQWRRIRDSDGQEGWINAMMLSGQRTALVGGPDMAEMRDGPSDGERLRARLEPGVIAVIKECADSWCKVQAGGFSGWIERKSLWGIYENENLN